MSARGELLEMLCQRYREAEHSENSRILDELVSMTGYHRKHAIRLLRGLGSTQARVSGPRCRPGATGRKGRQAEDRTGFCQPEPAHSVPDCGRARVTREDP